MALTPKGKVEFFYDTDPGRAVQTLEQNKFRHDGTHQVQELIRTDPPFFVKMSRVEGTTLLAADTNLAVEPYVFEVVSNVGMLVGQYLGLFCITTNRFYVGNILSIVGPLITMDTPLDSDFITGDTVGFGTTNMNANGSATPVIYTIRGADPGIQVTINCTRILFTCLTENAVNLADFGDIPGGLLRGVLVRRSDGVTQNHLSFKTNIEMKGWMLDWDLIDDPNIGIGLHGFVGRLTYAGDSKVGTAIQVSFGDELEVLIQDDLTSILSLEAMVEGYVLLP